MKKIISSILAFVIIAALPVLAACDRTKNENHDNLSISSNGGSMVVADGYLYFINGIEDRDTENHDAKVSGIYKVAVDASMNFTETPKLIISSLAGFEDGSLRVYGDYIYYASPSTGRDSYGEITSDLTTFYRAKLDGTKAKKIYTTKDANEDLSYAYYKTDAKTLHLVVFEENSLFSTLIGSKMKTTKIASDVSTVVFAKAGNGNFDNFIYYTQTPIETEAIQTGSKVFSILPNGEGNKQISAGRDVTLLEIRNSKLYFQEKSVIYATTSTDSLVQENASSFGTFTDFMILSDGAIVGEIEKVVYYYNWVGGSLVAKQLYSGDVDFLFENQGFIYFVSSNYLYRIDFAAASAEATKLSTAVVNFEKFGSFLIPEILGSRLFFYTEEVIVDDDNTSYSVFHLSFIELSAIEENGNTASRVVE